MSNIFKYKGNLLSEILGEPIDGISTQTTTVTANYVDTGIITGYSNAEVERFNNTFTQLGYTINGNSITDYATPLSWEWTDPVTTQSKSITPPSWAKYMTVLCIGAGGGGGGGGNGFDPTPLQTKNGQNGCTGGGGAGGEYIVYRGLELKSSSIIDITVGAGGQGGGSGGNGTAGGTTSVVFQRTGSASTEVQISAYGGNGGEGGGTGGSSSGGTANQYYPFSSSQWRGIGTGTTGALSLTADNGQGGASNRNPANGGEINTPSGYGYVNTLTGNSGTGGDGGIGGNHNNQGRQNGSDGQGGYIRIYWMP